MVRNHTGEASSMSTYPVLMHTALDATDVRTLAEFYRELLGLQYRPGDQPPTDGRTDDQDWLVLIDGEGNRKLAFHEVPTLTPTDLAVARRSQTDALGLPRIHDRGTGSTPSASRGNRASVLFDRTDEPGEPLYVLADPAGHPFCILVGSQ
jgi:hypothetical protein